MSHFFEQLWWLLEVLCDLRVALKRPLDLSARVGNTRHTFIEKKIYQNKYNVFKMLKDKIFWGERESWLKLIPDWNERLFICLTIEGKIHAQGQRGYANKKTF